LLATGKSNADIASELAISPQTVKKHLDHIYKEAPGTAPHDAAIRALRLDLPRPKRNGPQQTVG
jgi:DNA-binding NarL/FixJ family response regulator